MVSEKFLLIVNQTSGLGRGRKCEGRLREMSLQVHDKRIDVVCSTRDGDNSIENLSKRAREEGYSREIVAGGDGTCYLAVNGLAMSGIPLAIIPTGSGNDFSKGLGLPQKLEEAFWAAVSGKEVSVDLGMVDGRFFVNVTSFVFDAQLVQMVPGLKKNFSFISCKGLYLVALLKKLFLPMDFPEVTINNGKGKRILGLVVTNGPQYGGMFKIAPRASFTDGLLDVCSIGEMSKPRLMKNLLRLKDGTHDLLPEVKMGRASSLVITSFEELACEVDGEIFDSKKEYIITAHPKALKVIVPPNSKLLQ